MKAEIRNCNAEDQYDYLFLAMERFAVDGKLFDDKRRLKFMIDMYDHSDSITFFQTKMWTDTAF